MYLTSTNLVHYLLASGHVTRREVVHKPFSVLEIAGHHRGFSVVGGSSDGMFVKQLKARTQYNIDCLHREASCYRLAWSDAKFAPWQEFLPRLIDYDRDRQVVIVQRVAEAETLTQCHRRLGSFPTDLARLAGAALAAFHCTSAHVPRNDAGPFQADPPWIFLFHEQGGTKSNAAIKQLAEVLSRDADYARQLASLHAAWTPELLIHGDLKWSNCLVSPGSGGKPQLHLVDWEMAGWGDPLWDVAGGLSNYLVEPLVWGGLYAVQPAESFASSQITDLARTPMQSLWSAYAQRTKIAAADLDEQAIRCVRYLGARLLLSTFEYHQQSDELGASFLPVLEASRQCLCQPREMAALLLGTGSD